MTAVDTDPAPGESTFPRLFSPIRVGQHDVRNRTVITSHGASEAFRNPAVSPAAYVEYLRRRAAGGVGLIIAQPVLSDPSAAISEATIERHAKLAEAVRSEGAVFLLQLTHLGAYSRSEADVRRPPLLGFQNTQTAAGETAHRMTDAELEQMIEGYRRLAAMSAGCGFDGVEIHGAHGYLVQQSLTPSLNARDDKWGQDRTLFVRRLIEVARREIGPERMISYRTPVDDLVDPEDGGIGMSGVVHIVRTLLDMDEIDLLNTTIGDGGASYSRAIPNYRYDEGPNIPFLAKLRDKVQVDIPVVGVGRILSPAVAEQILESGTADMVAMTRAHITDPDLLAKVRRGDAHRVRPCVGANVCVNRKLQGYPEISCFHNPEVLRELELVPTQKESPKHILVVGAGPSGLKAAETAAICGYRVTIVDAGRRPGGRLLAAEQTAALALVSATDSLVSELSERGITVRTNIRADGELIREISPDHVILATGGRPTGRETFAGAAEGVVVSSTEALNGQVGQRVLVFDPVGANEGPLVAEALALRGAAVTYVTPCETVMPWGGALHRAEIPGILRRRCDQVITGGLVGDLDGKSVIVVRPDGETLFEADIDTLVDVSSPRPVLDLVPVLDEIAVGYTIVGDALAPRTAMHAFKEGEEAVLAL